MRRKNGSCPKCGWPMDVSALVPPECERCRFGIRPKMLDPSLGHVYQRALKKELDDIEVNRMCEGVLDK